jgi:ferrous iron transport protein A
MDSAPGPVSLEEVAKDGLATVVEVRSSAAFGELDPAVTRRLRELGFMPGAQVRVVAFGAVGRDPIAVRVAEGTFALRRLEAAKILVKPRLNGSRHA